MKIHGIRLKKGDDLFLSIDRLCREKDIAAGVILSGVGCVTKGKIRDASGVTVKEIDEPMEIVSLTGTCSLKRSHVHISFAKEDLSVIGGHLVEGTLINTTCELVIGELEDMCYDVEYDEKTGYDELIFKSSP